MIKRLLAADSLSGILPRVENSMLRNVAECE